jgi:endoglucanase
MKYLLPALFLSAVSAHAAVPAKRLQVLSRGANISTLFERKVDLKIELRRIAADGFTHVRVFVVLESLNDPSYLANLDRLVSETAKLRLAIIVCMISREHELKDGAGPDLADLWVAAWKTLGGRYRASSPEQFFPELANEPNIHDQAIWSSIQSRLHDTVRGLLPQHTILLTGSPLSMTWSLPETIESGDEDVLYTFHLYQPMLVTHQGADWLPSYRPFRGLAYPPNADNIRMMTNPRTQAELTGFARDGKTIMQREVDHAAAWSESHHVPLVTTEFGIYSAASPLTRAAWLREARTRLEDAHIGWTVWEYAGGFGVAPLTPHSMLRQALGLDH